MNPALNIIIVAVLGSFVITSMVVCASDLSIMDMIQSQWNIIQIECLKNTISVRKMQGVDCI